MVWFGLVWFGLVWFDLIWFYTYSRVHNSSDEVFVKILKKPSLVQMISSESWKSKWYLIWKASWFSYKVSFISALRMASSESWKRLLSELICTRLYLINPIWSQIWIDYLESWTYIKAWYCDFQFCSIWSKNWPVTINSLSIVWRIVVRCKS